MKLYLRKVASEGINHHVEHCIFVPASHVLFSSRCPTFRVSLLSSHFCTEKPVDAAELDLDEAWDENGFGVRVAVVLDCRPRWIGYNPVWRDICVCSLIYSACHSDIGLVAEGPGRWTQAEEEAEKAVGTGCGLSQ